MRDEEKAGRKHAQKRAHTSQACSLAHPNTSDSGICSSCAADSAPAAGSDPPQLPQPPTAQDRVTHPADASAISRQGSNTDSGTRSRMASSPQPHGQPEQGNPVPARTSSTTSATGKATTSSPAQPRLGQRLPGLHDRRLQSLFTLTPAFRAVPAPAAAVGDDQPHASTPANSKGAGLTLRALRKAVAQQQVTLPGAPSSAVPAAESAQDRIQPLFTLAKLLGVDRHDRDSMQVSELLPRCDLLLQHWQAGRKPETTRKNLKKLSWLLNLPEVRSSQGSPRQHQQLRAQIEAAQVAALAAIAAARIKPRALCSGSLVSEMQAAQAAREAAAAAGAKRAVEPPGSLQRSSTSGSPLRPLPGALNVSTAQQPSKGRLVTPMPRANTGGAALGDENAAVVFAAQSSVVVVEHPQVAPAPADPADRMLSPANTTCAPPQQSQLVKQRLQLMKALMAGMAKQHTPAGT